jgi:protein-S-isoprenylcysteine O-methyltransferase Ste14
MKATPLEFRFRFLIHAVIYVLGFMAPWNSFLHLDTIRTWQFLAAWPARSGWISFSTATIVVLVLGILCALIAALLRTCGTAYLGSSIVNDLQMQGNRIVAAGPYRYLRNPLYLGIFIHTFALALLMVPSGAIFTIVFIGLFELRLIAGEESFLTAKLGQPYLDYCARVPRIFPALTPRVPASAIQPDWTNGFFGETYMWGVVVAFAAFGWRYNSILITQAVLISLGISLVVRALIPKR